MNAIKEAIELIFGDKSGGYYLACFAFSTIGILIMLRIGASKRDRDSTRTPEKFNFWFMVWDNATKALATYALLFVAYRFIPEMSMLVALGIGFAASLGLVYLFNVLAEHIPGFKKFIQVAKDKP